MKAIEQLTAGSIDALRKLTEIMQWANAADADESTHPSVYASQDSLYGMAADAVAEIFRVELKVNYWKGDPNYGGNGTWFDDLMIHADALIEVKAMLEEANSQ